MEAILKSGDHPLCRISARLFGQFIEHIENCILGGIFDAESPLSDERGIRLDVLEKCKELAPPILRFPGGTVIGIYHWQDHVGPVSERKKMRNLIWGGRLCHEFGTAEFVRYCREIGAEPMLCVNMPTGSAEEAAHWVEYCNGTEDTYYANLRRAHGYEEPFNVKYWCIGNESAAEPDLGCQHDVEIYIREAWEFTKYMKLTDPAIKLIFVGANEAWNRRVLESLHGVCDYLSLHYYSSVPDVARIEKFEKGALTLTERMLAEWNEKEIVHDRWYRFPPRADKIRIALDEWNLWSSTLAEAGRYGLDRRYDWRSALWVASFLNMMIRHADTVGIANMAQMVNVIAPIVAEKDGCYCQTIFHPMKLYRERCGAFLTDVECDATGLDVAATLTEEGTRVIFAVNHADEPVALRLDGFARRLTVLRCDALDAISSAEADVVKIDEKTDVSDTVTVPSCAISVIEI